MGELILFLWVPESGGGVEDDLSLSKECMDQHLADQCAGCRDGEVDSGGCLYSW